MNTREQMNVVVVGHVDHGKSTVIGRLLADTGSLPAGKLEQVRRQCEINARPFEYAFLLDALHDEQAQGITIDTARCFFKTEKRDYIIIDAPGHVEFLKNMVSGAARAEAAFLVIDAHEGIAENSKRHGYLVSMLGIRQLVVLVNKMDLIGYDRNHYQKIVAEYTGFLGRLDMQPSAFIPVSARSGDNISTYSLEMAWYEGNTVLDTIDNLDNKVNDDGAPLRFPVQDVYKFTGQNDDRRIIAGTVESGHVSVGDSVVFYPSGKKSIIATIEVFNEDKRSCVKKGDATGFTLTDELYLKRGDIMCREGDETPEVGQKFHTNIFWMGKAPFVRNKKYKIKIGTAASTVHLTEVISCIDATELSSIRGKQTVERYDVAECVLQTIKPVAFDTIDFMESTARFVIVDGYDIAGGGILTKNIVDEQDWIRTHVVNREVAWEKSEITLSERISRNGHCGKAVILVGDGSQLTVAHLLERKLFNAGYQSFHASLSNIRAGYEAATHKTEGYEVEHLIQLGELSRLMTDAGLIFISALEDVDENDLNMLRTLNEPFEIITVVCGIGNHSNLLSDMQPEVGFTVDQIVEKIVQRLHSERIIGEYSI